MFANGPLLARRSVTSVRCLQVATLRKRTQLQTSALAHVALVAGGCATLFGPTADRTGTALTCSVHGHDLQPDTVPVWYGSTYDPWCVQYEEARRAQFPFAKTHISGSSMKIVGHSPERAKVRYCSKCRQVEESWLDQHPP